MIHRSSSPHSRWGALVLCADQEQWVRPQLEWLYPWFSRILVVDGACIPDRGASWGRDPQEGPGEIVPSTDGSREAVRSFPDARGKISLIEPSGTQAEVLNEALGELGTELAFVVSMDEFLPDMFEFMNACERMPNHSAFSAQIMEFFGSMSCCFSSKHSVLVACRPALGFHFTRPRSKTRDARELLDIRLLRYGLVDHEGLPEDRNHDPGTYLNRHPPPLTRSEERTSQPPDLATGTPDATIVIPFFEKVDSVVECLRAALESSHGGCSLELVLADVGCSEGLEPLIAAVEDARVRIQHCEGCQGTVAAMNRAVQGARGRHIVLLDPDARPLPGWLDTLVETADGDPSIGVVGSMLLRPDGTLEEAGGIVFSDGRLLSYGRGDEAWKDQHHYLREVDHCSQTSLLVRRDLWDALGGMDEAFAGDGCSHVDLCFQARQQGYKVVYQPRSRVTTAGTGAPDRVTPGFLDKWADVLGREHHDADTSPHVARERTRGKHILIINPSFPLFDQDAGSFRLFQIIRVLRRKDYRVTFLSRCTLGNIRHRRALEDLGVHTRIGRTLEERHGSNTSTTEPRIKDLLDAVPVDMAICYHYRSYRRAGRYVHRHSPGTKIVVDSVDLHFLRIQRQAEICGDDKLHREAERVRRKELAAYRSCDMVLAISEEEAEILRKLLPRTPVEVIPLVHPVPDHVSGFDPREGLLFLGSFAHPPNADAVRYLIEKIMPLVWMQRPDLTLRVVGLGGDELELSADRVEFLGYVEDLEPILNGSRIMVAPLRFGAGAKGKIAQALSCGLPVVTTAIGAEGLGLTPGKDIVVSEDPGDFAGEIVRLYGDRRAWSQLAENGRVRIEDGFSIETVATLLEERVLSQEMSRPKMGRLLARVRSYL